MAIAGNQVQTMDPLAEAMASLPQVDPTHQTQGDGRQPQANAEQQPDEEGDAPTLATASDAEVFNTTEALVRSQDPLATNRWNIDTHYSRLRSGIPFGRLEKVPNQNVWQARLPNGMLRESSAAVPNKVDDLANKVENTLMADPPRPAPISRVQDRAADAAKALAREFLTQDGGESGTDDASTYRWALSNAFARSSSFLHYITHPTAGG